MYFPRKERGKYVEPPAHWSDGWLKYTEILKMMAQIISKYVNTCLNMACKYIYTVYRNSMPSQ